MKVRFIGGDDPLELRNNKVYDVIGVDKDTGWYRIVDETNDDYLFAPEAFEVVDPVGANDGFVIILEESVRKNIEYTDYHNVVHNGYVEEYKSREDNGGEAELHLKYDDSNVVIVSEKEIGDIKILD